MKVEVKVLIQKKGLEVKVFTRKRSILNLSYRQTIVKSTLLVLNMKENTLEKKGNRLVQDQNRIKGSQNKRREDILVQVLLNQRQDLDHLDQK